MVSRINPDLLSGMCILLESRLTGRAMTPSKDSRKRLKICQCMRLVSKEFLPCDEVKLKAKTIDF